MRTLVQQLVAFLFLLLSFHVHAQTTGYSGTGANIDVTHYNCNWTIDPGAASKTISGSVTICFVTKTANVSAITFDFNKTSFNNGSLSVMYHGSAVSKSFPSSGNVNIITISLPAALPINKFDSVTINYSGIPPAATTQAIGYQKSGSCVYTLSESFEDRDWWPCKADMQDKADSLDITITCPSTYLPAANGLMVSNTVSGANRTVYYRHRYPIASYLVAIAVGSFTDYPRGTVNINGTLMPVNYFILPGHTGVATKLTAMDYCKQELIEFGNKFGDYPFKDEKYGMYEFAWGGGMEHQSFSAMSWGSMGSWSTIAHELAHQWFGDKVTFSTWNHLWLAEGFARY
jgi:aminopeptidase N